MANHIQALLELACPQRQAPASLLVAPIQSRVTVWVHSCSCKVGATSIYLSLFLSISINVSTYEHIIMWIMCVYVCTSVFHNLYVDIHIYIYICITVYLCIGFSGSCESPNHCCVQPRHLIAGRLGTAWIIGLGWWEPRQKLGMRHKNHRLPSTWGVDYLLDSTSQS